MWNRRVVIPTVRKPGGNAIETSLSLLKTQSLHLVYLYKGLDFVPFELYQARFACYMYVQSMMRR